jgi:cobyrinic acid a,c-diamide synthase
MKPQFLIAAPHSGAGKTTVTLGIIRALRNSRLRVQSFKCGPDYLDPKLHTIASGRTAVNLDRFMMDDDGHLGDLYNDYGNDADVLITEGVMGLFDGAVKMEGSSADLAALLKIPIVLIVNAKAMAYSVAALLLGFKLMRADIHIAGVIFNFVEHDSHYQLLKAAADDVGIMALGYLPKHEGMQVPSRHLGLKTGIEIDHEAIIEKAAAHIQKHIDLNELMRITAAPYPALIPFVPANQHAENQASAKQHVAEQHAVKHDGARQHETDQYEVHQYPESKPPAVLLTAPLHLRKRILVARDEAFNFLYAENIRALSRLGELIYFSPLNDTLLPSADLIYLPGGYPELHLQALSANTALIHQLISYYNNGGKFLAECGGMMYLGKYIADEEGKQFPMTGILDIATSMQHKKLSLGYKRVNIGGTELRGHEFHYSQFTESPPQQQDIQVWNARNEVLQTPVFKTDQLLASYLHFYFGNQTAAIEHLLFG